jgi:hypothetical protein
MFPLPLGEGKAEGGSRENWAGPQPSRLLYPRGSSASISGFRAARERVRRELGGVATQWGQTGMRD